jgi:hypothetical protein
MLSRRRLIAVGLSAPFVARTGFARAAEHALKMVYPDTPLHPRKRGEAAQGSRRHPASLYGF